ncbi:MAG: YIP1 family protein [Bacilli bacterium]
MKKYCTNCGEEINKEICDCKKNIEENNKNTVLNYVSTSINSIFEMIKRPTKTMKNFVNDKNYSLGLIIISIYSIINGLLLLIISNKICNAYRPFFRRNYYMYSNDLSKYSICLILLTFVAVILFACLLYFILKKLFNYKVSFKNTLSLVAISSSFDIIGGVVSIILVSISMPLVIFLMIITKILFLINVYDGMDNLKEEINKDTKGYIIVSTFIFEILVFLVFSLFI